MNTDPRWTVYSLQDVDESDFRELFRAVFNQEMNARHWQWKYGDGKGVGMLVRADGRPVAFYGGIERGLSYFGKSTKTLQVVDTMVITGERGTLSRRGPYFLAASTFLDKYIGYNRPYLVGYGFPNDRIMRLGEILGIQAEVGKIVEPGWKPLEHVDTVSQPLDLQDTSQEKILQSLWDRMQGEMSNYIVCERSVDYLRHRYQENPLHKYQAELVSDAHGAILGLVVVRDAGERLFLLDLLGASQRFPTLVEHTRWLAHEQTRRSMYAWITEPHLAWLGNCHDEVHDPKVRIPTSVCTEGPDPGELAGKWWLMAGDTDFL